MPSQYADTHSPSLLPQGPDAPPVARESACCAHVLLGEAVPAHKLPGSVTDVPIRCHLANPSLLDSLSTSSWPVWLKRLRRREVPTRQPTQRAPLGGRVPTVLEPSAGLQDESSAWGEFRRTERGRPDALCGVTWLGTSRSAQRCSLQAQRRLTAGHAGRRGPRTPEPGTLGWSWNSIPRGPGGASQHRATSSASASGPWTPLGHLPSPPPSWQGWQLSQL